jgi:drug/metabolite transporter (DMT)-like permease
MMFAFALGVVITRHRRDISMAPAICLSQIFLIVAAGPFAEPGTIGSRDLLFMVILGVGQMGLGLAFLTLGARLIPAAEVALITLLEIVLAPLWVWLTISETPATATLVGGVVLIAAVILQVGGEESSGERPAHGDPAAALPPHGR